jgi:hypothetical protein
MSRARKSWELVRTFEDHKWSSLGFVSNKGLRTERRPVTNERLASINAGTASVLRHTYCFLTDS